jgi:hypothetical protein
MMDPTEREHTMKRIALVFGIAAALFVAPSVAAASNSVHIQPLLKAEFVKPEIVKPEGVKPEVVKPEIVKPEIVKAHVATALRLKSNRISVLRPHSR